MSTRTFLFDSDATGRFDGTTFFNLPVPLPAPSGVTGQTVIPVSAAGSGPVGRLSQADPTFRNLVGTGGFWLRSVAINSQTGDINSVFVCIGQPQPTLLIGGNRILQTDPVFTVGGFVNVQGVQFRRQGPYVPAGWEIILHCDQDGIVQIAIEIETLPKTADAARAIKAQKFRGVTTNALA